MDIKNSWAAIFMIISALLGFSTGEVLDDKIESPFEKGDCIAVEVPEYQAIECPIKVIAYTDSGKYFCEGVGTEYPCVSTEEILSQLG